MGETAHEHFVHPRRQAGFYPSAVRVGFVAEVTLGLVFVQELQGSPVFIPPYSLFICLPCK